MRVAGRNPVKADWIRFALVVILPWVKLSIAALSEEIPKAFLVYLPPSLCELWWTRRFKPERGLTEGNEERVGILNRKGAHRT